MSTVETAARASLRADGRFCVVVGALVALFAGRLADPLGLSLWLTVAAGLVALAWGIFVLRLSGAPRWLRALTGVLAANYAGGFGLAVFALTPRGARLRLFLAGLAGLAVLWFAVTQSILRLNAGTAM